MNPSARWFSATTSNSRAAYQNARVVFEALKNQDIEDQARITILEVASGLGVFAVHFLNTFRESLIKS